MRQVRAKQNEFSMFFKDDWKVTSDLTLNLGIRYEYYGVPWILNGMTQGVVGGSENIFGGQQQEALKNGCSPSRLPIHHSIQ